jgi:hypothetical protein
LLNLVETKRWLGGAGDFLETGSLATETAEVEELRAAHLVGADFLDLVDNLGIVGEDTLDTLAEAHLADGEGALGALLAGNDHAFERLEAFFVALFDLHLHANGIAGGEVGEVGTLEFVSQLLHDGMDRHD